MDAKIAREYTSPVTLDLQRVVDTLDMWYRNYTTRRELRKLDDYQLTDIGIDQVAAQIESKKPFWQN